MGVLTEDSMGNIYDISSHVFQLNCRKKQIKPANYCVEKSDNETKHCQAGQITSGKLNVLNK